MINTTAEVLQKLKCFQCRGYLNTIPVMVKPDSSQICGRCFNILPLAERRSCIRQVGYEAVAGLLLFPCRYNVQGCRFKFGVNEADSHELECPFRFTALDLYPNDPLYEDVEPYEGDKSIETKASITECKLPDVSRKVGEEFSYTARENQHVMKCDTKLYGNPYEKVALQERSCDSPAAIHLEGAVSLSHNVGSVHFRALEKPSYAVLENNEITDLQREEWKNYPKCAKCLKIVKCEIYHCTFGHDVCKNCKGDTCSLCTTPINTIPRYCCENISKGCCVYLLYTELYLHSRDCEFREFKCIQQGCSDLSKTLFALKEHIKTSHATSTAFSNLIIKQSTGKDETLIMLAYENLFKCKRFCYDSTVEFTVEFVGPHKHAESFKFEVGIKATETGNVQMSKTSSCTGWNASALDQALVFNKNDIIKMKCNPHNFTYTLNLIKILKE